MERDHLAGDLVHELPAFLVEDYMEIEMSLRNRYMDGRIRLENDCMEDDYKEIENLWKSPAATSNNHWRT